MEGGEADEPQTERAMIEEEEESYYSESAPAYDLDLVSESSADEEFEAARIKMMEVRQNDRATAEITDDAKEKLV